MKRRHPYLRMAVCVALFIGLVFLFRYLGWKDACGGESCWP